MDLFGGAALACAGLLAGAVNGVAGGGTLIAFPAMLAVGYPPVSANVASALATLPGYVGGLVGYRAELRRQLRAARVLAISSIAGATLGATMLLSLPPEGFAVVAPFLVLTAVAALALQGFVARRAGDRGRAPRPRAMQAAQLAVSAYGGYFSAGLGVMLLAALRTFKDDDLHELNALKGALSLLIGLVSGTCFIAFGPVEWGPVAVMSAAGLVGGRIGVRFARRLRPAVLNRLIIATGLVLSIALLLR
ncbi:sulfite exporter TauE/SafE family protein [Dactylosporangium maewongense]|uniref:Probable membrane transporter protein n=1 Tax=Dactylosporangium maewongense TaxID=634393 RepID=A0ABP4NTJ6_9ACTN